MTSLTSVGSMERQYIARELESVAERIQSEVEKLKHISENYRKEYGGSKDDAYIAGFIGMRAETLENYANTIEQTSRTVKLLGYEV